MGETIKLYKDQHSLVKSLTDEESGRLLKAIFDYSAGESNAQIMEQYFKDSDRMLSAVWGQFKEKLDFNAVAEKERSRKATDAINTRWQRERSKKTEYDGIRKNSNDSNVYENKIRIPTIHNNTNTKHNSKRKIIHDEFGYPIYADTRERVEKSGGT